MPKKQPNSVLDAVDRLLIEREQDYQGALQIVRNDLKLREKLLNQFGLVGLPDKEADDALAKMISETRRGNRDVVSEGSMLFEDDVRNYAIGNDPTPVNTINTTEGKERKRSQPIPGTQAHHPASVSSTESLVQNMDEYEIRKLWKMAADNGYTVGSQADGFIPLSEPAHTTGGRNWGSDFAHVGADGKTMDTGRFKTPALPKGTTATQAWGPLKDLLDEQRLLNERAYSHPVESRMRADAEATVGKPIEWRGPVTGDRAVTNKAAKSKGLNATTITRSYDRNPGLLKTNQIPNVTVAVPGGGTVPRSLGKPAEPTPIPRPSTKVKVSPTTTVVTPKPPAAPKPKPKPLVGKKQTPAPIPQGVRRGAAPAPQSNRPTAASIRNPGSASQQIRSKQRTVPDAIHIHPGMSLPSHSLIQGV